MRDPVVLSVAHSTVRRNAEPTRPTIATPPTVSTTTIRPPVPLAAQVMVPKPQVESVPTNGNEMKMTTYRQRQRPPAARQASAGPSTRRFRSLDDEETMDLDEQPTIRVTTKRKREADEEEEYIGDEGEEEEEEEEVKVKGVKREHGHGTRKPRVGTGRQHSPQCERCAKVGAACWEQQEYWACIRCAEMKVGCARGDKNGKRRNVAAPKAPKPVKRAKPRREVIYTSSEDEGETRETGPRGKPAPKAPAPRSPAPKAPAPRSAPTKDPAPKDPAPTLSASKSSAPPVLRTKKGKGKGIIIPYQFQSVL